MAKRKSSETVTENLFRSFYGTGTFIEKSAIPSDYGFTSKAGTDYAGYPDFFLDTEDYCIVVEAKATKFDDAVSETKFYMLNNKIKKDIVGIAVAGQDEHCMRIEYYYKLMDTTLIEVFETKDTFLPLTDIKAQFQKAVIGDMISDEDLTTTLTRLNKKFNDNNVRDTERSLFFSALMIALSNTNFRRTYKLIQAPETTDARRDRFKPLEAHYLNYAILEAVTEELKDKINNHSKEFNWADRFAFIKTIDIPLAEYIEIISDIESRIFLPFKNDEKQDILGRAYRIFLKRAGKVDNKNIILTPDHIKELMVKLARLTVGDVVLDTCTGSGGFLMESMETMIKLAAGDSTKIDNIKGKQLIGFEIDYVLFSLACSNMFLHGDGRTNMIYRSSLLTNSAEDKALKTYIKSLKPTKVIINPPYEGQKPIKFVESAIEYLEPNGKLIVIMPRPTLRKNVSTGITQKILKKAKLDFVIKMPLSIFKEQGRTVYTSIFGFTKTPHNVTDEVLFCDLKEDGLVSVQHKGRVDKLHVWQEKEEMILDAVSNGKEIPGFSEKRRIFLEDELIPYGVQKHVMSLADNLVKVSTLFQTDTKGCLQSESNNPNGDIDFITAGEEWKKHDKAQYDGEAIVYAVGAEGSLGRAHYVKGKFVASNLCIIMTEKDHNKYPVDLEFYTYYLMSIRDKIVSILADGTSKLTIDVDEFDDYLIEYFPIEKQCQMKKQIRKKLTELNRLQDKLQRKKDDLYLGLSQV